MKTFVAFLLSLCLSTPLWAQQEVSLESRWDSISYALGVNLGNSFKTQSIQIESSAFAAGLNDKLSDQHPQLSDAETQQLIAQLQREIQARRIRPSVEVGQEAPEIAQQTPEGEIMKLSDFRGKYVLVDFWASWCGPCRKENPYVVEVYNKYKEKGFEIFGVSLDRNKESWLKAIEKDGLTWSQVSDLKYWKNEAAQTYGVRGIPFTVLVDPEGKVAALSLRGSRLEAELAKIFAD